MIEKLYSILKNNNSGSTMVEVLAGFIILTLVIAECMLHMINVSGEMVKKSKDTVVEQEILNREMYKKDARYIEVCGSEDGGADGTLVIKLTVDEEKTDDYNMLNMMTLDEIILSDAKLYRFDCEEVDMSVFKLMYEGEGD